jgi:hypothetical protein
LGWIEHGQRDRRGPFAIIAEIFLVMLNRPGKPIRKNCEQLDYQLGSLIT